MLQSRITRTLAKLSACALGMAVTVSLPGHEPAQRQDTDSSNTTLVDQSPPALTTISQPDKEIHGNQAWKGLLREHGLTILGAGAALYFLSRRIYVNELNIGSFVHTPNIHGGIEVNPITTHYTHLSTVFGVDLAAMTSFYLQMFKKLAGHGRDIPFLFISDRMGGARIFSISRNYISGNLFGYDSASDAVASGSQVLSLEKPEDHAQFAKHATKGQRTALLAFSFDEVHSSNARAHVFSLFGLVDFLNNFEERWRVTSRSCLREDRHSVQKKLLRIFEFAVLVLSERPEALRTLAPEFKTNAYYRRQFSQALKRAQKFRKILTVDDRLSAQMVKSHLEGEDVFESPLNNEEERRIAKLVYGTKSLEMARRYRRYFSLSDSGVEVALADCGLKRPAATFFCAILCPDADTSNISDKKENLDRRNIRAAA